LKVVKYLKEEFGLEKVDAQADDNHALKWSSANGHLEVVKYLIEVFGLKKVDERAVKDILEAASAIA